MREEGEDLSQCAGYEADNPWQRLTIWKYVNAGQNIGGLMEFGYLENVSAGQNTGGWGGKARSRSIPFP